MVETTVVSFMVASMKTNGADGKQTKTIVLFYVSITTAKAPCYGVGYKLDELESDVRIHKLATGIHATCR